MMIGEIGYRETLIDTVGTSLLPFPVLSVVIFAIFVVTMAILLANLLVRVSLVCAHLLQKLDFLNFFHFLNFVNLHGDAEMLWLTGLMSDHRT